MTNIIDWFESLSPMVKPLVLLAYAAFGIFLLLFASGRGFRTITVPRTFVSAAVSAWVLLISLRFALHGWLFIVCLAIGAALFAVKDRATRDGALIRQSVAVVAAAVSLAWWLEDVEPIGWAQAVLFALTVWCMQTGFLRNAEAPHRWFGAALYIVFAAMGFAVLANTTAYQPGSYPLMVLMHHQGAYLGAAFQIKAGLVPFYDIPLQYGLGPSLLIAAAMEVFNPWIAMGILTVAASLIMGLLILRMALATRIARGPLWTMTAAVFIFISVFLWPGVINWGSIPTAAPSGSGLRFLPVTLVAFLLFFGRTQLAAAALVPAVLWSPEVAGMSLAVYFVHETARVGFVHSISRTAGIAAATFAGLAIVHHAIYHVWIQPDVMFEYILHVPSPIPIHPLTDFLFLSGAMALAAWNVSRTPVDAVSFRRDLVTATLLFAVTSYYLGRSHPNNICNLMPFIALVALRSLDGESPAGLPGLPRLTIIGMSAAAGALMLSHWATVPFRNGFSIGSGDVVMAVENGDEDAASIRLRYSIPENVGIADAREIRGSYPQQMNVWTPMDPGSVWLYIPSQRRQLYIQRSAARLRRPGWLILDVNQQSWLNDFRTSYRIDELYGMTGKRRFLAAHLTPLNEEVKTAY